MSIKSRATIVTPYNDFHAFLLRVRTLADVVGSPIDDAVEKLDRVEITHSDFQAMCKALRAIEDDLK